MLTALVFILVLGLLIFVHEFGHFIVAKFNKIGVEEFAFGFPPKVICKKVGETNYCLNLIPIGGYVRLVGEEKNSKAKNSFTQKGIGARSMVIVAGVLMNFILAGILFGIGYGTGMDAIATNPKNLPGEKDTRVIIAYVEPGGAASMAGLEAGDVLSEFKDISALQNFTKENKGKVVAIKYSRLNEEKVTSANLADSETPLGVSIQEVTKVNMNFFQAIYYGFVEAVLVLKMIVEMLWDMIVQLFQGNTELAGYVAGPVGIYKFTGLAVKMGFVRVLELTSLLSLNLALLNILPFPALDGGKLVFLGLEKVFRKKVVREEVENIIHLVGFVLLILLMAIIAYKDIEQYIR